MTELAIKVPKVDMNIRKEILRFLMVGVIINGLDLGVYVLLIQTVPFSMAKGISFTCAGLVGYLLNKFWTFDRGQRSYAEVGRYILINSLALIFNVLTNRGILNLWPGAIWPALLTATALTGLLTFICFKWWVFKVGQDTKKPADKRPTIKERLLNLWKSHSSPHEIALGLAIGVFIGISQFYGFHILTALLAALIMKRVNKVAIFLGMNISLPLTIPFITWAAYNLGRLTLGSATYPRPDWSDFKNISYRSFFDFFYTLTVGSLILGLSLSVLFYFLTVWFLKRRRSAVSMTGKKG